MKHLKKIKRNFFFVLAFFLFSANLFSQSIIYVKADATGGDNGNSWTDAYTSLQSALDDATAGDAVWVATGTYKPSKDKTGNDSPTDARTKTFQLVNSVSLFGGFAGTETNFDDRDWKKNETILSGDLGTVDDMADNSYNVVRGIDHSTIDGFTVTLGNANGPTPNETNIGGGLSNNNVSYVKSLNCIFKNDRAEQGGGAANYFCGDSIIFFNCQFLADTAGDGGGIGNWDTRAYISSCLFTDNYASSTSSYGGAIFNWGELSTAQIINCTIYNNKTLNSNGAIHNRGVTSTATNCILWGNNSEDIIGSNGGSTTLSYSCIEQSGYAGSNGNIDDDPLLDDPANGDYHLTSTSPCIDAGNGDVASQYDFDGFPRINDETVTNTGTGTPAYTDMGMYELRYSYDAMIHSIDEPALYHILDNHAVMISMRNYGTEPLTSVPIEWEVDGNTQTTFNWTGNLLTKNTTESFQIGTYSFDQGSHTILARCVLGSDENRYNDTLYKYVKTLVHVDAGIVKLDEPDVLFVRSSSTDIKVSFKNYDTDSTLTNVDIDWTVDGTPQPTFAWTGGLLHGDTTNSFSIGSYTFSGGNHDIKVWTKNPNGFIDDYNDNDTLETTLTAITNMDAGVSEHINPPELLTYSEEPTDVEIKFQNFNTDSTIQSITIEWEIDGTPQTPYNWNGTLPPEQTSDTITIGAFSFSRGQHELTFWTKDPNNDIDDDPSNDTLDVTIYSRAYDIGLSALYTPTNPDTTGLHPVNVSIKNYSADSTITSAAIQWEVEGGPQTQFDWTGSLLPGETSDSIEIGTYDMASTGTLIFKIWTKAPNGDTDDYHENDTLSKEINIDNLLHGTFTIGATGDFLSFEKAVDSLVNGGGVCGPVVFNVETGIYNEQITIPEIPRTNATNTITFQSATGDSTDVTLSNTGGGFTVTFDGADYIIFKNMTISTDADGSGIYIKNDANNNQFLNNLIIGETGTSSLILDYHGNIFSNNRLVNASYGINIYSDSGSEVRDNIFENQSNTALRLLRADGAIITGNTIISASVINGIFLYDSKGNIIIEKNKISLSGGGIGIYFYSLYDNVDFSDHIYNNFIHINTSADDQYGIYSNNNTGHNSDIIHNMDIFNNNINIAGNATVSSAIYLISANSTLDIRNNILVNKAGGRAINTDASFANKTSDHNCLYSNGTYLVNNSQILESHQNSTGQDTHSFYVPVKFTSNSDLHTFNPYINNQGTPIAEIDKDIDGEVRDDTNPDIGADEYNLLPALSGTYSVDPSAPQLKTFTEAIDTLIAVGVNGPVLFEIENGTYNEQLILPEVFGASATNTITFQSANGDSTNVILTYGSTDENSNYTLKLDGADFFTFKEITIEATGATYARIIEFDFNACKNIFSNNQFIGVKNISELVYSNRLSTETEFPDTSNSFINNRFENGATGISFTSNIKATGTTIENNDFINQTNTAIYFNYYSNLKILSNYFHSDSTYTGIYLTELSSGDTISNNIIHLPAGGTAINLYNCDNASVDTSTISNNFIYLNTTNPDHGINIYHISAALKFLHNTVHITGDNTESYCLFTNYYGTNNYKLVINNIFDNEAMGQTASYCYYNPPESDYNNLYSNGQYLINGSNLEDWQSSYNQDLHSITVNPYFTADTSWHVKNPSLNGAGTPLAAVTTDIDGEARDASHPDIGADEYDRLAAFSGSYAIGSSAPLFKIFKEAVDSMLIVGVEESVVFNVEDGTYNEQLILPEIFGTSETNTITFKSVSEDSTKVILTHAAAGEDDNYTLKLDGADYIIFKKITLKAYGAPYSRIVELNHSACHNTFTNNQFLGVANTSELVHSERIYPESPDTSNSFINNRFMNGAVGISFSSNGTETTIENNEFINQSDTAIYFNYFSNSKIISNYIHSNSSYTGIYFTGSSNGDTINNNIIQLPAGGTGINLYSCDNSSTDTTIIANNFIYLNATNPDHGINLYYAGMVLKFLHNTVHIVGDNTDSYCLYNNKSSNNKFLNNIFANEAKGQAADFYYNHSINDYNNYYSNGQYLINGQSWADWQSSYHQTNDFNSKNVNPYFTADTSWHVQNLALNGAGTPIAAVTSDLDGELRDANNPDIGADEFTPSLSPMHGIYTIGGTSPNFTSINNAVDSLFIRGVDGAVTMNIASGTYNEQISLQEVYGASATNTITFQSATGDSTDVIVRYKPTLSYKDYTWQLDGADYIAISKMTITIDTTFGSPIKMLHSATNNSIANNNIFVTTFDNYLINDVNYPIDSNNVFIGNYFENGNTSIKLYDYYGQSKHIQINNNTFKNFSNIAVYVKGADFTINDNQILFSNSTDYNYAFFISADANILRNNFQISGNGSNTRWSSIIYCSNSTIANNMINLNGSCTGITAGNNSNIYYNTVKISGSGKALIAGNNSNIKNNVFVNTVDRVIEITDTVACDIDYNVYFSNQSYIFYSNGWHHLDDWQQDYGFDLHSFIHNAEFIADTNLHTSDPWLNNVGTSIAGITTDIDGNIRNTSTPDIGADEFSGSFPLSGVYTIGNSGDFSDFNQAVDSLNFLGVKDSVIFNVLSGTYNEQFTLSDSNITRIPDTSAIVFQSQTGDSTDVTLQFDAGAANNYTINLDSASFVNIKNITLKALNNTTSVVLNMRSSSNNIVENNILQGNGSTSPVIYSGIGIDNNNLIKSNLIIDGKIGILFYGEASSYETNNYILDNTLSNQYSGGVFVKYQKWDHIESNIITHNNPIEDTTWVGIALLNCKGSWGDHALVANNMISFNATQKSAGIHLYAIGYQNIYYNSVNIFGEATDSRAFNQEAGGGSNYISNNIFCNKAGGLVIYTTDLNSFSSDYNDLFTNGDNLAYSNGFITDKQSWISTTNKDNNSLSEDPLFNSDSDLHINQNILIGRGIPVPEVTKDFDGELRDTVRSTIGAYRITSNCSAPLAGNYTIGTSGDYQSFNDVVTALATCGINGSINFNVLSGTYNEQIDLSYIRNNSSNYPITFQSQSGDSTDVVLQYDADSLHNYVLKLAGVKNFTLKNMTFHAIDTSFGRVVVLSDSVDNINFSNNHIIGVQASADNNQNACVYSDNLNETDTMAVTFDNNRIVDGSYGIDFGGYQDVLTNLEIVHNTILNQNYAGIYGLGVENIQYIKHNFIQSANNPAYGIFIAYNNDTTAISCNKIILSSNRYLVGIEIYSTHNIISNNFISLQAKENAHLTGYKSNNTSNLFYNSILCYGDGSYDSYCVDVRYSNNSEITNNNLVNKINNSLINYDGTPPVSDYNNLYNEGFNLVDWQSSTGNDFHSVSFMPDFVSNTDLHTHAALLNGKGIPISGIIDDIDGEPRDATTPDIGADEFDNTTFYLEDDITVCVDAQYTLNAGYGFDSYLWSTGSDSCAVIIDSTGIGYGSKMYYVTVSSDGNNYNDSVTVTFSSPIATPITDYCLTDSVLITAGEGMTYNWSTGDTTQSIYVSSGNYRVSVTVTDANGCSDNGYIHIRLNNHPANINTSDTTICRNQSITLTANNSDNCSYYWSTGDTTQSIIVDLLTFGMGSHTFYVTVTNNDFSFNCESIDSATVTIDDCLGVGELKNNNFFAVYPNPTEGIFTLEGKNIQTIEIFNMNGEVIIKKQIEDNTSNILQKIELDLTNQQKGIYFIKILTKNGLRVKKLILM